METNEVTVWDSMGIKAKRVRVKWIKVDPKTLKQQLFPWFVIVQSNLSPQEMAQYILDHLKHTINLGDFVVLPNNEAYRRIRNGWRKADNSDLSELIASQL